MNTCIMLPDFCDLIPLAYHVLLEHFSAFSFS